MRGQSTRVALGADGLGGGFGETRSRAAMQPGAQFFEREAYGQPAKFAEQVAGERRARQCGPGFEPAVQSVGHVADPDHGRHSKTMNTWAAMSNGTRPDCIRF